MLSGWVIPAGCNYHNYKKYISFVSLGLKQRIRLCLVHLNLYLSNVKYLFWYIFYLALINPWTKSCLLNVLNFQFLENIDNK